MNGPPRIWHRGQRCKLTTPTGKSTEAEVILASPSGISLCLKFEAIMDGWAGMAPILWRDESQAWADLMGCEGWKLEVSDTEPCGKAAP